MFVFTGGSQVFPTYGRHRCLKLKSYRLHNRGTLPVSSTYQSKQPLGNTLLRHSLSKQNARHWDLPGVYQRRTDISDFHWNCRSCSQEHNFRISTHITWRKQTTRICKSMLSTYCPVRHHLVQQPSNSRVYTFSTFIFASLSLWLSYSSKVYKGRQKTE